MKTFMPVRRRRTTGALALVAAVVTGCGGGAGGGAGDLVGSDAETTLTLVAYAAAEPGWGRIIPAFAASPAGEGVAVRTSYGASAEQSRSVVDGKPADLVNFSVEPDVTRLVEADKVAADWDAGVTEGVPFGSVVTFVVRAGNPKNIRDWDDLLRPGLQVVSPSPLSSGSAKWNLLAPYAAKSGGGKNPQAGLDFVGKLVGEHVETSPSSGGAATEAFLQGTGDVLLSSENEAIHLERQGTPVEHINPAQTFEIESPVAVVTTGSHRQQANALKNYLYTPEAQQLWAEAGFRPVDPAVGEEFAADFPAPQKLWTVDDLGGWDVVDPALFDTDNGSITTIYRRATG